MEKLTMLNQVLLLLMLCAGMGWGANPSPLLQHPEQGGIVAEIEGKVQAVDAATRHLTVQDKANQQVTVQVGTETRITDNLDHVIEWSSLRPGDRIILYYNTREKQAVQIDLQSDLSDALIGTPKAELR